MKIYLLIFPLVLLISTSVFLSIFAENYIPPRQQLADGTKPENVICKEGLELIFKSSNGNPACVRLETKNELFKRGWAYNRNIEVSFLMDKPEYNVGEKITITMKNTGTETLLTRSTPIGFGIINEENKGVKSTNKGNLVTPQIGMFHPDDEVTFTWDQTDYEGKQVKAGVYWTRNNFSIQIGEFIHDYKFEKMFRIVTQN